MVVGGRSAGGRPFDRRSDDRAARVVSRSCAGRPQLRLATRLYWLASNLSTDSPLVLAVDDLQWCDAPSARALAFIARRLSGQPSRSSSPRDRWIPPPCPSSPRWPAITVAELVRPAPLTHGAAALWSPSGWERARSRLRAGVPRGHRREPVPASESCSTRPRPGRSPRPRPPRRGRRARPARRLQRGAVAPGATRPARRRACPDAQRARRRRPGDRRRRLSDLTGIELEDAMTALIAAGVIQPGGAVRFAHPILRSAIYGDLSPAERERLHCSALQGPGGPRGRPPARWPPTSCTPTRRRTLKPVTLLREAAREALALGDAPAPRPAGPRPGRAARSRGAPGPRARARPGARPRGRPRGDRLR